MFFKTILKSYRICNSTICTAIFNSYSRVNYAEDLLHMVKLREH